VLPTPTHIKRIRDDHPIFSSFPFVYLASAGQTLQATPDLIASKP
jgi:hypothetical protein